MTCHVPLVLLHASILTTQAIQHYKYDVLVISCICTCTWHVHAPRQVR